MFFKIILKGYMNFYYKQKKTHTPFKQYLSIIILFYFNNFNIKCNSYFQNILKRVNELLFIRKKLIHPSNFQF